jgi:hypothetical protein
MSEFTLEYMEKCHDIYMNGGTLFMIERTDTNEFCHRKLNLSKSNEPSFGKKHYAWSKDISMFTLFYLSKYDAEKELKFMNLQEGQCDCCGRGGTVIPVNITDHLFIKQP